MKKVFFALVCMLTLTSLWTPVAHADVNDFVIESFDADYSLSRADKQGQMRVVEQIKVNFSDLNHGILRAIPSKYKNHSLQLHVDSVTSESGAPTDYTIYTSNGNEVLKIGNPDKTVTGRQSYAIVYTVRNVISFYPDHDELYWDINGDQWQQTAQEVSVALHLPSDLELSRDSICYTGTFGSTEQSCTVSRDESANVISVKTTRPMQGYETMSIVAGFKKDYFRPSAWYETAGEYAATALLFLTPLVLIGGTAARHWWKFGRDAKGRRVIVPEYEAPDGLKAIEAGTVADFRTDNRDITATIIDLAIRGYIKIIETTQDRKLLKDVKKYSLQLQKDNFDGLKPYEARLLRAIFDSQPIGTEISLDDLKYKLATTSAQVREEVKGILTAGGYFGKTPITASWHFVAKIAVGILFSIILAVVANGGAAILGIGAGVAVLVICLIAMPNRTPKGVAAKESILGLKLYLQVAESERIKKMQSPDAPYAAKSAEPKKTVELFEKLLPYAIVLGVEEQWAKKFESIYRAQPDWYQGNARTFSVLYLAQSLNTGVGSSINSAFSSPSNSGSSGFSGGGSGGGGGGGGGGGW